MWTKNEKFICDHCQRFATPYDSYTPFGCSNPADPEPYDPTEICELCSTKLEISFSNKFKNGSRSGDWCKSKAEVKSAKEYGLIWVNHIYTDNPQRTEILYSYVT